MKAVSGSVETKVLEDFLTKCGIFDLFLIEEFKSYCEVQFFTEVFKKLASNNKKPSSVINSNANIDTDSDINSNTVIDMLNLKNLKTD